MIKKFFGIGIEPITWGVPLLRHSVYNPPLSRSRVNELTEEVAYTNAICSIYVCYLFT